MSKSIDNQQFEEWVDQFLNDTISPEAAEQLLNCVQQEPERLEMLSSQLQADRLLAMLHKQQAMSSIAETVLERLEGQSGSNGRKNFQWTKVLTKVAAALVILLGLGTLLLPKMGGQSDKAIKLQQLTEQEKQRTESPSRPVSEKRTEREEILTPESVRAPQPKPVPKPKWKPAPAESIKAFPASSPKKNIKLPKISGVKGDSLDLAKIRKKSGAAIVVPSPTEIPEQTVPVAAKFVESETLGSLGYSFQPAAPSTALYGRSAGRSTRDYRMAENFTHESYAAIVENEFARTTEKALSTFSIDVDTASYSNIRRYLNQGSLPPPDAVRIEEMINYFEYDYKGPEGEDPFSTSMALTSCPWNRNHQLLRVGLQGKKINEDERKDSNLVFLLDVSGSMNSHDKLPLLKKGFEKMVRALGERDRVAIVVYAGSSGVVLDSTSAINKEMIIGALSRLKAGGSTAGGQGIELAYRLATDHFIKGGINRIILATDGDFNVGISDISSLQQLIEAKRKSGVFLSVLGFGTGNLQDAKMEMLANKGNGNYFYIDSEREAEKVMVKQLTANMVTIAKDVKIQIEFNPALVRSYRLIGYENRLLAARDFADDTKDAGEIGAGHQVTALYELIPAGAPAAEDGVELKYSQPQKAPAGTRNSPELLTLKLRYKQPEGSNSRLLTFTLDKEAYRPDSMDESFRWATATAAFGMHLRNSDQIRSFSMQDVLKLAKSAAEHDPDGYRRECIGLMQKALQLKSAEPNPQGYPQWQYR